jgi:multimeric flavodoxin WrbA
MSKLIAFVGSPRKHANIYTLVNRVVEGAKDNGLETKIYYLNELNIRPCQSCMYCRQPESERCTINDDLKDFYSEIKDAEYLILASPVYIHQISGLLKNAIDRFYPLTDHKHRPRFGIKKAIFIYSQGAPIPLIFNRYFRYFEKSLKAMGIKPYKRLVMKGAFVMDAASKNPKMLEKAYKMGNSLFNHEIGVK